ncbi:hypothetical protein K439DRAFT_797207 [Ramaria rubella]|nr:hypothetical protein K439DRAFT_797207 [Ramaria rubella]
MPFISRLKKLGTLPVPELQTTLTVYLINLEHSQETNLVYTACDPISADATPPAHLRFDCPDGHTKRGDVLIWASRVRKKACYVHACWVFDGTAWVKPSSDSEVMMDHPEHPEYQLVILSGPYVKWELKPDPDREPSLTIPDPPPVRPGARGTVNTIVGNAVAPLRHRAIEESELGAGSSERPYDHTTESRTPDGSAVLCGSGSPISDAPAEDPSALSPQNKAVKFDQNALVSDPLKSSQIHLDRLSSSNGGGSATQATLQANSVQRTEGSTPVSGSNQSPSKRIRERPRGARALPSTRQVTPLTVTVPPTPDSTKQTRSRAVRSRATSRTSTTSIRHLKRTYSCDDGYASPFSPSVNHGFPDSLPAAKRRRVGEKPRSPEIYDDAACPIASSSFTADREEEDEEDGIYSEDDDDSDYNPSESTRARRGRLVELQKRRGVTPGQANEGHCSTVVSVSLGPGKESLKVDNPILKLREALLDREDVEAKERIISGMLGVQDTASEVRRRDQDRVETALRQDSELQIAQIAGERDRALRALEEFKASVGEEMKKARQEADELARAHVTELQQSRESELSSSQARDGLAAQLTSTRAERDSLVGRLEAHESILQQAKEFEETEGKLKEMTGRLEEVKVQFEEAKGNLEDTKLQLEEQRRRATSFETSLRVAQEALQRQRTLSQEIEARQRSTIAQLAKEFQEKDQNAKKLAEHVETMTACMKDLTASLLKKEHALLDEKDSLRRLKDEMECVKKATQEDRLEIARLKIDEHSLAATKQENADFRSQIDHLHQERTDRETALAAEVQQRVSLEKRVQELQKSTVFLDHLRNTAEANVQNERAAKENAESRLTIQTTDFAQHISLADKERGRLEQLLLERRSSLQLDLRSKCRDLESLQAECAKMRTERTSERERSNLELLLLQQRLTDVVDEKTKLHDQLSSMSQELQEVRRACASVASTLSTERVRFDSEISSLRSEFEDKLATSHVHFTESIKERERIEAEREALEMAFKEQGRSLMVKQAEYTHLKAHLSSERERLTVELSATTQRFEGQLADSRKQLETAREEHKAAIQGLQIQRASVEVKACRMAEALKAAQVETSKQVTLLQTERDRFDSEHSIARKEISRFQEELSVAQKARDQADENLTKERIGFTDEQGRLELPKWTANAFKPKTF